MKAQQARTRNSIFNPAKGVFIAQDQRPSGLMDIEPRDLSPLLRGLLVIDGTVTTFIEAYAMEPIEIERISQETTSLAEDHRWLAVPAGEEIVNRKVALLGSDSGRLYAFAESLIVVSRLDAPIQRGLEQEPGGLGRILVDSELESRREGLWYGHERIAELPERVRELCEGEFLTRTYRLIAGGVPLMTITERFPLPADSHAVEPVSVVG
jgi:chorismate-pyruvate lyase